MSTTNEFRGQLDTFAKVAAYALAGDAYFTLVSKATGTRFTYHVSHARKSEQDPGIYFVRLLVNPDVYAYIGIITPVSIEYKLTKASKAGADAPSQRAIKWFVDHLRNGTFPADKIEFWHEGRCGRCGRKLTVPESIESGIGPVCAGKD